MLTATLMKIGALVAPFLLIDKIIKEEHRAVISKYLFADMSTTFSGFESAVIRGLLQIFMIDGKLSKKRVWFLSLLVCYSGSFVILWTERDVFMADGFDPNATLSIGVTPILMVTLAPLVAALVSFPGDLMSLSITRWLFVTKAPVFPMTFVYFLIDVVLSTLASLISVCVAIGIIVIWQFFSQEAAPPDALIAAVVFAILANLTASLIVSLFQVFAIVFGILLRLAMRSLYPLRALANHSAAPDYPFAVIGLVFAVCVVIYEMWSGASAI